jgi:hypothetical protein
MKILLRVLLFLALAWTRSLVGQALQAEPREVLAAGTRYLQSVYAARSDSLALLLDGERYYPSLLLTNGYPYFAQEEPIRGTVVLENRSISGVALRYDVHHDQLVYVPDAKWLGEVALNKDRIRGFRIGAHRFEHLYIFSPASDGQPASLKPGYYEILYDGAVSAFAKRAKIFIENQGGLFDQGKYWDRDTRYVVCRGHTYPIRKKKELIHALDDTTGALRGYMRKEKFSFGLATDEEFVRLLAFYDTL